MSVYSFRPRQIDGKLLCWLCTLSNKRAQAKARQVETERRQGKKRHHSGGEKPHQVKENSGGGGNNNNGAGGGLGSGRSDMLGKNPLPDLPPEKGRMAGNTGGIMDPNSSDHVIAMTQLKETIASLQKKIGMKDKELLERDKMVRRTSESERRNNTTFNKLPPCRSPS